MSPTIDAVSTRHVPSIVADVFLRLLARIRSRPRFPSQNSKAQKTDRNVSFTLLSVNYKDDDKRATVERFMLRQLKKDYVNALCASVTDARH